MDEENLDDNVRPPWDPPPPLPMFRSPESRSRETYLVRKQRELDDIRRSLDRIGRSLTLIEGKEVAVAHLEAAVYNLRRASRKLV